MTKREGRAVIVQECKAIEAELVLLRDRINKLGDDAVVFTGGCDADMLACFAANSTYGTSALLRELIDTL